MGKEVVKLALNNPEFDLVCAIDKFGAGEKINDKVVIDSDLETSIKTNKPDIVVDFTQPSVIFENIKKIMEK